MTQNTSNKIPTLGTLLATALGIAYGAWAVIVWGSGFNEEHLPSSPQAKAQSCQVEWGNKAPCRRWRQNHQIAKLLVNSPSQESRVQSQDSRLQGNHPNRNTHN